MHPGFIDLNRRLRQERVCVDWAKRRVAGVVAMTDTLTRTSTLHVRSSTAPSAAHLTRMLVNTSGLITPELGALANGDSRVPMRLTR